MPLAPEQTILDGKYRILRLIGEGGMARVWQAEEPRFGGRRVAIKEPRGDLLPQDEEDLRRRYQQEVRICAALEQARVAHIVRALTAELVEGTLLLVLEYMPGGDLAGLLKEHPGGLPIERAVAIVLDLLRALEGVHSHSLEMVHRDLKPSNVLFDDQGRAYLSDFGLVQLAGVSGRSQLRGGSHPGTPLYMAPEQGRSPDPLAPSADLYALGCVFFEMLTGRRYKRHKPGTRAGTLRPEVPGWLDDIVARALAEDPWERWQTAGEMSAALEAGQAADRARREEEAVRQREAQERARREAEAGALRERLAGLEANARVRLSAGDPAAALAALEQIRHLEPRYPGLAELAAQAQSAMDERQRREAEARRQAQCAESRRLADVALRSGDWPEALRLAGDLSALGEPGVGWAKEIRRQAERVRRAEEAARRKQEKKRPPWLWPALAALAVMVLAGVLWAAWPDRVPDATPTPTTAAPVAAASTTVAPTQVTPPPPTETPARTPEPVVVPSAAPSVTPSPTLSPSQAPMPTPTDTPPPGSAWADEVIAFSAGTGAESKYGSAQALLGAPDLDESPCCTGILQLGKGGSVLLAFTDNTVVDGDGADFAVYGESVRDDFLLIEVSADGQAWAAYSKVSESPGGLDLGEVGLDEVVYVRLTDLQPGTSTGAEVDAVVALNSGRSAEGTLPALPGAVARGDVVLREGPDGRMKEVGRAAAGAALTVLGRSPVSGWVKVQAADGAAGWASIANVGLNVSLGGYEEAQAPATPTPKVTPTPKAGATRTRSKDGMGMVYVPAGEFTMGSPEGEGDRDEHPQHKVYLDSYWIDRTEVTNDQYRKCLTAGACAQPGYWGDGNYNGGSQPVVGVNWNDAVAYCTWAGARLPTEAEWEKAARGVDGRRYPWGNEEPDCNRANFYGCAGKPVAVGSYASGASPYGALDMAGNVWEWVSDWYDGGYYGSSPARNPQGPASGDTRVLRGGSWSDNSDHVRSAFRGRGDPDRRINIIGFRCVSSSTSSP